MQLLAGGGDIADIGNGVENIQLGKIHRDSPWDKLLLLYHDNARFTWSREM